MHAYIPEENQSTEELETVESGGGEHWEGKRSEIQKEACVTWRELIKWRNQGRHRDCACLKGEKPDTVKTGTIVFFRGRARKQGLS